MKTVPVAKSHSLNGAYLLSFWQRAVRQRKHARIIIEFDNGIVVDGRVTRVKKGRLA